MDDPFMIRFRALWKKDLEDAKKEMERAHRVRFEQQTYSMLKMTIVLFQYC